MFHPTVSKTRKTNVSYKKGVTEERNMSFESTMFQKKISNNINVHFEQGCFLP